MRLDFGYFRQAYKMLSPELQEKKPFSDWSQHMSKVRRYLRIIEDLEVKEVRSARWTVEGSDEIIMTLRGKQCHKKLEIVTTSGGLFLIDDDSSLWENDCWH
jgi:hypothetical protein